MNTRARGSLVLDRLVKRYGDHTAVNGVSMEIAPGEFITLLGSSGSGKTTTLNIIAGFVTADEGSVRVDDADLSGRPPHKRGVGMVFQNYALFPHMTAAENIAFPLKMRRMRKAEIAERVERALAIIRLEKYGARYPRQLSGGQQQRVALARAIVFEPPVLLMDEPLGALDKKLREALQLEIMRIHRELGVTVVYVTHDQEEALVMSDRVAVYNEGQIEQLDRAEELYERPASLFVADFMGESNIFRGRYYRDGNGGVLRMDGAVIRVGAQSTDLADGAAAAVVVRPERTLVGPDTGNAGDGHNVLPGTLREVIYLGSARKYLIELPDGTLTQARVGAGSEAESLRVGERVCLRWAPPHSVLLPDVDDTHLAAAEADQFVFEHDAVPSPGA